MDRDARSGQTDREAIATTSSRIAAELGVAFRLDEPLGPHTTMGVGGPTPCFLEPDGEASLAMLLSAFSAESVPFRVLGAGSNLIVDDAGVSAAVVSTGSIGGETEREGSFVRVPAGFLLPTLVRKQAAGGLGGFEFLEGIPGSVGGSLAMNAGAGGRWIGDIVAEIRVVDPAGRGASADGGGTIATVQTVHPGKDDFGYRRSFVRERGLIVTAATLRGEPDEPEAIHQRILDSRAYRVATQPLPERSSGCIFKNPDGDSAGALVERLSLKGQAVGGAAVSEIHGNFIVNRGNATCDDILALIDRMRERARGEEGIELQMEVIVWRDE